MVTKNTTLFAKWTINSYTVTFNSRSGSEVAPVQANYNAKIRSQKTTRTGYTFGGWYKESALTNAWDFATDVVTKNTTLFAKWTAVVNKSMPSDSDDENEDNDYYEETSSLPNQIEIAPLSLYPNPAVDFITVSGLTEDEKTISISDLSGRRIIHIGVDSDATTIDVSNLPTGTYILTTGYRNVKLMVRR